MALLCAAACLSADDGTENEGIEKIEIRPITEKPAEEAPPTAAKAAEPARPEKKEAPADRKILSELGYVLDEINKNTPVTYSKISDMDSQAVVERFLKSLNAGIRFEKAGAANDASKEGETEKEAQPYPAVLLAAHKILYARFDSMNDESFNKFKEDCENNARLANKPTGTVIDLRSCHGYGYEPALRTLALVAPLKKLGKYDGFKLPEQVFQTPCILIVGPGTEGAAEIFSYLFHSTKKCLIIGSPTAGTQFKARRIPLKSGDFMLVPEVDEIFKDVPLGPLKPDVPFAWKGQIKYEELAKEAGSEKQDKALQRAVELIHCFNSLTDDKKTNNKK